VLGEPVPPLLANPLVTVRRVESALGVTATMGRPNNDPPRRSMSVRELTV